MRGNRENAQPAKVFWGANIIPSNFAVASGAGFLAGPEKSPAAFINGFQHPNREKSRSHGMSEFSRNNRVDKDKATSNGKGTAPPTREVKVTPSNYRGEIRKPKLMEGEGEAKVGLREGGDGTAKSRGHGGSHRGVSFNGNKGALVKIYVKTSGGREGVQEGFEISDMLWICANNNEGVIGILEDGAREVVDKWVKQEAISGGIEEKLLEDVRHNVKEERG